MNKITHKLALWKLEQMMIRSNKLDQKIEKLALSISKYENLKFEYLNLNKQSHKPNQ